MKFLKLSLIMFLTMVSLSSFCQYPTVKVINKDSVVVMTLKQGQEINNQFSMMKDSISSKNKTIIDLKNQLKLSDSLRVETIRFFDLRFTEFKRENDFLLKEKERIERKVWTDRKERRFTAIGFVAVITGWLTFFALSK